MRAAKSNLPQGTLDLLILKVVALGPVHGYAIAQRLLQVSRDVVQVPQGSLYPALHRLENRGLLAADWNETETGREAKFYRLTAKGRKQLKEEAASWLRLTEAIGLILMTAGGSRRPGGAACSDAVRPNASSTPSFATHRTRGRGRRPRRTIRSRRPPADPVDVWRSRPG